MNNDENKNELILDHMQQILKNQTCIMLWMMIKTKPIDNLYQEFSRNISKTNIILKKENGDWI